MLSNFITVGEQVLILFVLIGIGFLARKTRMLNKGAIKGMTSLVLNFVTPCVMINAFQECEFNSQMLRNLIITALSVLAIHISAIIISALVFREKNVSRRVVLKFATIFSNCGFMSLPLQQALLGADGVFYGSVFVAIFNLVSWTYGLVLMSGNIKDISLKRLVTNPGVVGVVVAIILWVCKISLPTILSTPISYMAALNTPVPMIVIGCHLATANVKDALTDIWSYISIGLRMIIIPLATLFVLYICGVRGSMLIAIVIATSAPTAATTTMFATSYDRDASLSVSLVSLTTIISLITMPLIVALAQLFA